MRNVLLAWVGNADLAAMEGKGKGLGPIAQAATDRKFDIVMCLNNHPIEAQTGYMAWLKRMVVRCTTVQVPGSPPCISFAFVDAWLDALPCVA